MNTIFTKTAIKFLLRKRGRDQIPLGSDAHNDDIYMHLVPENDNDTREQHYTIRSIEKGKIHCLYYEEDKKLDIDIYVTSLSDFRFKISYFYEDWHIRYDSLTEAFFHILFGVPKVRRFLYHKRAENLEHFTDRMKVLRTLVQLRRCSYNEIVNIDDLCEKLYGRKFMKYNHFPHIKDYPNLQLLLLSLKQSGDIDFTDKVMFGDLKVIPKSIETLSNYEISMSKHNDLYQVTRWQLWVAILMALLALSNFFLAYIQLRSMK